MLLETTLTSLTVIVLFIASIVDIKTREVADWLTYGFLLSVFGVKVVFSFQQGYFIIGHAFVGFLVCAIVGLAMYYGKLWGGADTKLLMGMGALFGITYPISSKSFTLLWFFLILLFVGALFGVVWMVVLAIKHSKEFRKEWKKGFSKYKGVHTATLTASILLALVSLKYSGFWILAIIPYGFFQVFLFVKVVEDACFVKKVSPTSLTEGDWLSKDVVIDGKKIMKKRTLEEKDIVKLQKLGHKVSIKEGVPFVPSFLLSYLVVEFGLGHIVEFLRPLFGA